MKTYQIIETVYREFFIEAESFAEASDKLRTLPIVPYDEWSDGNFRLEDIHDGTDWEKDTVSVRL